MISDKKQRTVGPLVSICIPVYNGETYIRQAIESVLAQTYTNFELIISDNLSTDKTLEIVDSIRDDRIKISKNKKNLGLVGNFNACIHKANGKYVKVLCCDDVLSPDAIKKEVDAFENNKNVTVVTGCSTIINSVGKTVMTRRLYKEDKLLDGKQLAKRTLMMGRNYFGEPTITMFRRELAVQHDIFNDESVYFCVDWDGTLLMAYEGNVYYISEPIAAFRISEESTSVKLNRDRDSRVYSSSIALFKKHQKLNRINLNNVHFLLFKCFTRVNIIGRGIIQKLRA
jgi:glycosyltransferase involved in cell wall biosynthesis